MNKFEADMEAHLEKDSNRYFKGYEVTLMDEEYNVDFEVILDPDNMLSEVIVIDVIYEGSIAVNNRVIEILIQERLDSQYDELVEIVLNK